ncbi:MAG: glycogen debranching protein GlgX [Rhodospirillales bacterium]|nr:glycogen debranching protein GlgX [Rhodospirillales bacterium]
MTAKIYEISRGTSNPVGATCDQNGVNFSVFSAWAEKIELCLFSADGTKEIQRLALPERDGDLWHGYVPGLKANALYGYRAHGPFAPEAGHRFNANKLLLDPYAKKIHGAVQWSGSVMGYQAGSSRHDLSFDTQDSAQAMPKSVVQAIADKVDWQRPCTDLRDTIIYEAHAKGLTAGRDDITSEGGCFLDLCAEPMLDHLLKLGVTAIELLPPQAFVDDQFLVRQKLRNYWGYQTIGFFCPEPRYLSESGISDFQTMVRRFHEAGIEVLIDVVYNHTAEGNELGPTLSFRGLDNLSYYKLQPDNPRYYQNYTGTGNTLNLEHPMVLRMVLDSLRYWVEIMGVDGFRFDLASVLGRTDQRFDRNSGFFKAIRQDPVLSTVKLIAEPWDIGPGGYQLGAYPPPFLEWNDRFRDGVRQFWRGDQAKTPELAKRLAGSARQFDHSGRAPTASVNFITSHDGFTLQDVVSYNEKHNQLNGEENNDGHGDNHTDNLGVEGLTAIPEIKAARDLRKRNMLATLMLSQGTPMLLAGDEIGNTQGGNNNVYCQDNATGWVDWKNPDLTLLQFVQRLTAVRKAHPVLRQRRFLHGNLREDDVKRDLSWRMPDGSYPSDNDWKDPGWKTLCVVYRSASDTPAYDFSDDVVFAVFNNDQRVEVVLPVRPKGWQWVHIIDTTQPRFSPTAVNVDAVAAMAHSVQAYALERSA